MTNLSKIASDFMMPSDTRMTLFINALRLATYLEILSAYAEIGFFALEAEIDGRDVDAQYLSSLQEIIKTTLEERGLHL